MGFFRKFTGNSAYFLKKAHTKLFPNSPFSAGVIGVEMPENNEGVPEKQAIYSGWLFSARLGQPRGVDIAQIRQFSKTYPVQMVMNTFKKRIYTTKCDILLDDDHQDEDLESYAEDIKKIKLRLKNMDNEDHTISDLISESITDIGTIDASGWNLVYSADSYTEGEVPIYGQFGVQTGTEPGYVLKPFGQRTLVKVRTIDGGTILKDVDMHKNLLHYWQYSFLHPFGAPLRFERDEIIYMDMNKVSYSVYGFGPVQAIQQVLEILIQGTRHNKDLFKNNAIPDAIVSLPDLKLDELKRLKRMFVNDSRGKTHEIKFVNWPMEAMKVLTISNKDLQWLEGQKFYTEIVFGIYNVSPKECGFFKEGGLASSDDGQKNITVMNALNPYFKLYETASLKLFKEILQKETPLILKFQLKDSAAEKTEHEQNRDDLDRGALTVNEYRRTKGRPDVEWGDEPLKRPFNPETDFTNFAENPNKPQPEDKPEDPKPNQPEKGIDLVGEDMIKEAKDYSDFLLKTFNKFEDRVLNAVDELDLRQEKTFGSFLSNMFNSVNTVAFASYVKQFLKMDMLRGISAAEEETGVDIGFTEPFKNKLMQLYNQQLEGYMIHGKKWPGIKGVTREIQAKVIQTVQEGIDNNLSTKEVKQEIGKLFDGFSESRSARIARTETTNILNESKLLGYKESGISGRKGVSVALDNRTSPICRRMHAKYANNPIPLDEDFVDDDTMQRFATPSFHVSCRTSIYFQPD